MSGFMSAWLIFQNFQYARVLNSQVYAGFTYFCKYDGVLNMCRDAIMEVFWIFQDSEYAGFLHMQAFYKVLTISEYDWVMPQTVLTETDFWICLVKISEGFEYGCSSKYARARNMARLWICECFTGCWICFNNASISWIWLNKAEYAWICLHLPK